MRSKSGRLAALIRLAACAVVALGLTTSAAAQFG
jgi:hypothetical protein